jgi:rubrerythrin
MSVRATPGTPGTLDELLACALAIEVEAAERYGELADVMETHNNREVADLFRHLQKVEGKHADAIRAQMGQRSASPVEPQDSALPSPPESPAHDDVHYLMQSYHALAVALAAEERAQRFFDELARVATVPEVRDAALRLAVEEREHVELVRRWIASVPKPDADWAVDPDPPRYVD